MRSKPLSGACNHRLVTRKSLPQRHWLTILQTGATETINLVKDIGLSVQCVCDGLYGFGGHTGQILWAVKNQTGEDLGFYAKLAGGGKAPGGQP